MEHGINDLKDREQTQSDDGATPCDLDDQNSPNAKVPTTDRDARTPSPATETSKTDPVVLPFDRSALVPSASDLDSSSPSKVVVALTPPNVRSAPKIRPVRHPPIMGCALHPPATTVTLVADPRCALQSYIGIRSANIDALLAISGWARNCATGWRSDCRQDRSSQIPPPHWRRGGR